MSTRQALHTALIAALAATALFLTQSVADAAEPPIKEVIASHFGWEVDKSTKGNVCTVASGNECQPGKASGEPGGVRFAPGVTTGATGNLYIADEVNQRIQELTPAGEFVMMFGKDVNKNGTDRCTKEEQGECQPGKEGTAAGEFKYAPSVVDDPVAKRIYVLDQANWRIQEFTEAGEFVLMIGRKVNKKGGDLCTQKEVSECQAGEEGETEGTKPLEFNFAPGQGDLLAVGGPEHLLYVGDEQRIQVVDSEGGFRRQIPLTAISSTPGADVWALAVDQSGDVYLTYGTSPETATVRKIDASGNEVSTACPEGVEEVPACWPLNVHPRQTTPETFSIRGLAIDSGTRLALALSEQNHDGKYAPFGLLLDGATAKLITGFRIGPAEGPAGMAFDGTGRMYVAGVLGANEIIGYEPLPVAELETLPGTCSPGPPSAVDETDVTLECHLAGDVNPESVSNTEVWFEWGRTSALGNLTQRIPVATPGVQVPVDFTVREVRPGEGEFYYRLAGADANDPVPPEEAFTSGISEHFHTPIVAPYVGEEPEASYATQSSAAVFDTLNPEGARTRYRFRYAPACGEGTCEQVEGGCERLESCANAIYAPAQESHVYGRIGTTQQLAGLRPSTRYAVQLVAESENAETGEHTSNSSREAMFVTAAATVDATTLPASEVTTTTAVLNGTVDAFGQAATYAFELGTSGGDGAPVAFSVVTTGTAKTEGGPQQERAVVVGLQPGGQYVYRISARYGNAKNPGLLATGASVAFETAGFPVARTLEPVLLPVPAIPFPSPIRCRPGYKPDRHGKCVRRFVKRHRSRVRPKKHFRRRKKK